MEENRQENGEMTMQQPDFNGYNGGESPKKSRKGLWIGLLAVLILMAALSPFVMAMMNKSNLRKNPALYALDSLNNTDYTKSRAFEISLDLSEGFDSLIQQQLVYMPVEVQANEVVRFIEGLKLKLTSSDVNYKETGEKPMVSVRYDFLYRDKDVFDMLFRLGEKGLQFEVVGKKLLIPMDLKAGTYEKQQELVEKLKKDPEIREILNKLFAKTELESTDKVEEISGQKCDVLKVSISLMDIYEALKSLVGILDSNQTVKELVETIIDQAEEIAAQSSGYEAQQIAMARQFLQSGMLVPMLEEAINSYDDEVSAMIEQYGIRFEGMLYIDKEGVVRSDIALVIDEISTMFIDIPAFSIMFRSYRSNMANEGAISEGSADLVLDESNLEGMDSMYGAIMDIEKDVIKKVISSPGFAEMKEILSKFIDVDELIDSAR